MFEPVEWKQFKLSKVVDSLLLKRVVDVWEATCINGCISFDMLKYLKTIKEMYERRLWEIKHKINVRNIGKEQKSNERNEKIKLPFPRLVTKFSETHGFILKVGKRVISVFSVAEFALFEISNEVTLVAEVKMHPLDNFHNSFSLMFNVSLTKERHKVFYEHRPLNLTNTQMRSEMSYVAGFLNEFGLSFLKFLNEPKIRLREVINEISPKISSTQTEKYNTKISHVVELSDLRTKYVNRRPLGIKRATCAYSYSRRGHWRKYGHVRKIQSYWKVLKSERWRIKRNLTIKVKSHFRLVKRKTKIWVVESIIGKGPFVNKRYLLTSRQKSRARDETR